MMDKKRMLIYRDEALRELEKRCDAAERLQAEAETEERRSRLEAVAMAFIEAGMTLKDLQAVEECRRGRWEITDAWPHNVYCSECNKRFAQTHWSVWEDGSLPRKFCPNCGAVMENGE